MGGIRWMVNPDDLVENRGEPAELMRVTDPVFNEYDELDLDASVTETEEIKAIFSQPSYSESQRLGGRIESISAKATIPSDTDVDPDREGRADRLTRLSDGTTFKVAEKNADTNPLVDVTKLSVMLEHLPGR